MSIEVRVPEEIKDYKESIIFGLSIRQLVCGGIALGMGIPTFFLLNLINFDLATYGTMCVVAPAFLAGFTKPKGYKFETYFKIRLNEFLSKAQRGYKTEPDILTLPIECEEFRAEVQQQQKEKEKQQLEEMSKNKKRGVNSAIKKEKKQSTHRKATKTKAREYDLVEVSEKAIERQRKIASKTIKARSGKGRKKKQKVKEAA